MIAINYKITGFDCGACAMLAQKRISKIEGVEEVVVQESGETKILASRDIEKAEITEVLKDTNYKIV